VPHRSPLHNKSVRAEAVLIERRRAAINMHRYDQADEGRGAVSRSPLGKDIAEQSVSKQEVRREVIIRHGANCLSFWIQARDAMTLDKIYYGYMALIGIAAGAVLVVLPQGQGYPVPPFFWVLIAAALFEAGSFVVRRGAAAAVLTPAARLIGFVLGLLLMLAITLSAGVSVNFL
jgi:tRNA threonylcarbamoyladenosine modification (KEOPS) complex  Pcc1 subunit